MSGVNSRTGFACGLLTSVLAVSASGASDPPPFQLVRADELYSPEALAGRYTPPPEPYKYLPLSEDGETYLSFGGEFRERYDDFNAPRFGIGSKSDAYELRRILLHLDLHITRRARLFVQLGKHDVFEKRTAILPVDKSPTNIQNLFVDLVPDPDEHWRLRLGRQEMLFNSTQRFVAVREGPNFRQSYDGARVTWQKGAWTVNGFSLRPVIVRQGAFDNEGDPNTRFSGLHVSRSLGGPENVIEGYWYALDHWNARYGTVLASERRRVAGLRFAAKHDGWDADTDLVWQYGTYGDRHIRAWALGSDIGYTFPVQWKPRPGFRVDAASGGSAANPKTLGTFNPLFPKGLYFDESTLTTYANLLSVRPSVTVTPYSKLTFEISEAWRWKQNQSDALYLMPFVPINSTANSTGSYVGQWTVVDSLWRPNRWLTFQAEYVHVAAGPLIRQAGGHNVDFGMLIAQLRF